jgi:arsenate reductase (glutaredoxin)
MRKVFYLSTCSTSRRIIEQLDLRQKGFDFQDIKVDHLTAEQLAGMHKLVGSYEALFSKIARKYKELNLKHRDLSEDDYRQFILSEYTFLKRPVIIINEQIFIGSGKKNLEGLATFLQ